MASRLYRPPENRYDLPFTWVFDGTALTDGQDYRKLVVYMQGGYGDFVLRRFLGFNRLLLDYNDPPAAQGGQFQIFDAQGAPLQAAPIYPGHTSFFRTIAQWGVVPELIYPELSTIKFDLFRVLKDPTGDQPGSAQLAFQGVRRMKGPSVQRPGYRARPKYFSYELVSQGITDLYPSSRNFVGRTQITDYDFELYNIELFRRAPAVLIDFDLEGASFVLTGFIGGESWDITVTNEGAPLTPFSITVDPVAHTVVVQGELDGAGVGITTTGQAIAAWNANPVTAAIATASGGPAGFLLPPVGFTFNGTLGPGGAMTQLERPYTTMWLYDSNKVACSSAPMLDIYMDGSPPDDVSGAGGSIYGCGAIVPPLWYPKDSQVQIDFYSQITDPQFLNSQIVVYLVGRQYIPC